MRDYTKLDRRHFLVGSAGVTVLAGAGAPALAQEGGGLPDYVSWKEADAFIRHSAQTLETKRGEIGLSAFTPNDIVYVRNNLPSMTEEEVGDPEAWEIAFEGLAQPGSLTLAELRRMEPDTVACVLQCSGNGRAFFDHETSGSQWSVGAAANVEWTGVPVARVVEEMGGIEGDKHFMTSTGGEKLPEGIDPKTVVIERSVPVEAMERAMLAYEMNGEPIPLAHGGPVRMVIPGYYGVNNVKHLKRVAFDMTESEAAIQQTGYRIRPVGEDGAPDQPSMYDMSVKSWVTHPAMDTEAGRVQIWGVAMGGTEPLDRVEVSTDGGESWSEARFVGTDLGPYAWRPFILSADLEPGTHRVASRATTASGATQPETFEPNHRGYGHNGWDAHAIDLTVG